MRHVISLLIENESGALSRVSGLFSARGYNIESLTVAPTEDFSMSRMTIVTTGSDEIIEQITKQLNKIIEVVKVRDLDPEGTVIRELCLIKTHATSERARSEIIQYANIFRGRIVDAGPENLTLEITGTPDKIDALIDLLRGFGIKEIARTGPTAISRGSKTI